MYGAFLEMAMERLGKMPVAAFVEAIRPAFDRLMAEAGEAINAAARDGCGVVEAIKDGEELLGVFEACELLLLGVRSLSAHVRASCAG